MCSPTPIFLTRDLLRQRPLPSSQKALSSLVSSFYALLRQPNSQPAALVRGAFIPALTGSDARATSQEQVQAWDEQIRMAFEQAPTVVIHQGVITHSQVDKAWSIARGEVPTVQGQNVNLVESVFLAHALHQELEQARADGLREEEANLSMMILASLSHELAHWLSVKTHGFAPSQPPSPSSTMMSDTSSMHSVGRTSTINSVYLAPSDDVGVRAVQALVGSELELVTLAIGDRQVTKRKISSRRPPALSPPVIYSLIGDTPAIRDVSSFPREATSLHAVLPWAEDGDTMWTVTSVLTPAGTNAFHGSCVVR